MSDEYISKQAVLNLPQSIERNLRGEIVERSVDVKDVEALKPADVAPVVHGEWIEIKNRNNTTIALRCNKCRQSPKHAIRSRFCPNCGAKMDAR